MNRTVLVETAINMEVFGYTVYYLYLYFKAVSGQKCPDRPHTLLEAEEICYRTHVEFIERVQQTSKTVLNFAKKKLGMDVQDEEIRQKCEYYQCILQQLRMINSTGYPEIGAVKNWIENNVIYNEAVKLETHTESCFENLDNCTAYNSYFDGFTASGGIEVIDDATEAITKNLQNVCDLISELVRCLSFERTECPIFQYP